MWVCVGPVGPEQSERQEREEAVPLLAAEPGLVFPGPTRRAVSFLLWAQTEAAPALVSSQTQTWIALASAARAPSLLLWNSLTSPHALRALHRHVLLQPGEGSAPTGAQLS